MSFKISVDAGYGFTKVLASNGKQTVFPSLVGYGKERLQVFSDDTKNDLNNMQVTIKEKEEIYDYFIGELAKRESSDATYILGTDRVSDHRSKSLILTACSIVMQDYQGPVDELIVGLPLQYYSNHREELQKALENTDVIVNFKTGGFEPKRVRFNKVSVYPQAAGALWAQIWNDMGELRDPKLTGLVGLIDVGFKTTDFIVIDLNSQMQLRSELSGTLEQGMRQVLENTQRYFENQVGSSTDPNEFEKSLFNNDYKVRYSKAVGGQGVSKEYNLAPIYNKYKEQLANTIKERVRQKWGSRMNFFDVSFLAGGGALALSEYFKKFEIPVIVSDRPQMANAKGFLLMSSIDSK